MSNTHTYIEQKSEAEWKVNVRSCTVARDFLVLFFQIFHHGLQQSIITLAHSTRLHAQWDIAAAKPWWNKKQRKRWLGQYRGFNVNFARLRFDYFWYRHDAVLKGLNTWKRRLSHVASNNEKRTFLFCHWTSHHHIQWRRNKLDLTSHQINTTTARTHTNKFEE